MTVKEPFAQGFAHAARSPEPDLAVAALMIARVEYPHLDAGPCLDELDRLGREAHARVAPATPLAAAPDEVDPEQLARVKALNRFLYGELGFAGNDRRYDDPRNSCLNQVLLRRTGIPITMALVYLEVGRRAGLRLEGVNFPGHFLVCCPASPGSPFSRDIIIDAFHNGAQLTPDDCLALLRRHAGADAELEPRLFRRATKTQILTRMLSNLKRLYVRMHSMPQARHVTSLLLALDPSSSDDLRDRGLLSYHLRDFPSALRDLEQFLRLAGGPPDTEDDSDERSRIWEHIKALRKRVAEMN